MKASRFLKVGVVLFSCAYVAVALAAVATSKRTQRAAPAPLRGLWSHQKGGFYLLSL